MTLRKTLEKMGLNNQQINMLIGTLLGDGNLQTYTGGITWRYRVLHATKSKEYVHLKYSLLKDYCNTAPKDVIVYDKRYNKNYKRTYFNTINNDVFKVLADVFYKKEPLSKKWIKIIPKDIENFFNFEMLAYFYMDDGSVKDKNRGKGVRFCTECYTKEEALLLQKAFKTKLNIRVTLTKHGKGYRIYIPEDAAIEFHQGIEKYMHSCFLYKLRV